MFTLPCICWLLDSALLFSIKQFSSLGKVEDFLGSENLPLLTLPLFLPPSLSPSSSPPPLLGSLLAAVWPACLDKVTDFPTTAASPAGSDELLVLSKSSLNTRFGTLRLYLSDKLVGGLLLGGDVDPGEFTNGLT